MTTFADVARVLGLPIPSGHSAFGLIAWIEDGLPVRTLDRLAGKLAPGDTAFKYRLVPKATYERRKVTHRLSLDEGERLARLAQAWTMAVDVWQDEAEARDFLFRPHAMLEDRRPVDVVIQSEIGAGLVLDVLGRLRYGSAA
ncbi:antitoxin Xre/MbcA/ParS toxin-binding domain-containing protein [Phreatobacter sp. AB_2022a]|uniref:antitoxin Xre/MbcA/ParS toxin-binding domain-containing protein n=1 Tax=Phreatobacter sp. AB_2022a TaxID=3003134 RepID=UPI0022872F55|nr:antitoxin Xre-like helix-turn-helix domain-containing protein [Phreatobacter sp. AB_2022a]MCZ0736821.1 DUF2384 domain-containing protein [Phreatobacter sp. AB_2022a]